MSLGSTRSTPAPVRAPALVRALRRSRPPRPRVRPAGTVIRPPVPHAAGASDASASASSSSSSSASRPTATELYLSLREMEAAAEAAELECVANANNNADKTQCTVAFLDAAEDIQAARLAVRASGVGAPPPAKELAAAEVKSARRKAREALEKAAEDEIQCALDGGGAECTAAFNDAWERAEERQKEAVTRHRGILRRWVRNARSGERATNGSTLI